MSASSIYAALPASAQNAIPTIVTTAALYVAWRIWRFTIQPTLHPDEPKQLPHLIPFLGHVREMPVNAGKLFAYGSEDGPSRYSSWEEYFGNTREIFAFTVMGQEMYIATSPDDVLSVYKESKRIELDSIIKDIMDDFGCTDATVNKIFETKNGMTTSWMDLCHANF
ncbi:hypothetical protein MFIFM68171_07419 [Madurella fahalii]|uniref:Cytochrome P450 n=1 Tax=Madurella fahalii TaxID=1157608 RepID=A0ABQ0GHI8_9PEZI